MFPGPSSIPSVAGAYVGFQVNSRRMFGLCENHELKGKFAPQMTESYEPAHTKTDQVAVRPVSRNRRLKFLGAIIDG